MKKSTLIVQSILAAAIIALYILHFTGHKTSGTSQAESTDTTNVHVSSGKIAYILIDSIFSRYEFAKELMSKLDTKQSQLDADLKDKGKSFQSSALDLQNKMQKGLITRLDAEQAQQQLASQQQNLYALQNQYTQQIAEENQVNQRKILNSVMDYLKEYNKTKHYEYILAQTFPSEILYTDEMNNITNEVIDGLNAEYAQKQNPAKK